MLLSHWLAVSTLSTVTRSNITMMSGPNRLPFMVVTLSEPSWKGAFSSYFCAHAEYHHWLSRTAAPAIVSFTDGLCPPSPLACNDAVSFDTGVAFFQALDCFFFRSLLATFQTWIRFPVPLSQHHCTAVILSLS